MYETREQDELRGMSGSVVGSLVLERPSVVTAESVFGNGLEEVNPLFRLAAGRFDGMDRHERIA